MLRRITLQNFMSHKHTVIELSEGLTVLTDPNNCGKSAIVAALQILATNSTSTHVVRHGEKECTITAETDDGHVLCWNRKRGKISYTLNGEDVHRLGRSEVPAELQTLLKLPTVETEAGKSAGNYDIHFGEQKSPIFLLGDPGSRAASFFASSSDATHLITMQHRHRQRVAEQKRDFKKLTAASTATATDLEPFATMDEVQQQLDRAEESFAAVEAAADAIKSIQLLIRSIGQLQLRVNQLSASSLALNQLQQPPTQHDVVSAGKLIFSLKETLAGQVHASSISSVCRLLQPPPEQHPAVECNEVLNQLRQTDLKKQDAQQRTTVTSRLETPPPITPTERLAAIIQELPTVNARQQQLTLQVRALKRLQVQEPQTPTSELSELIKQLRNRATQTVQQQARLKSFRTLTSVPELHNCAGVADTLQAIKASVINVANFEKHLTVSVQSLNDFKLTVQEFVAGSPDCPTCGAKLDANRVLAAGSGIGMHVHDSASRMGEST